MSGSGRGRGHGRGRGEGRGYNDYRGDYRGDYYGNHNNGYAPYAYAPYGYAPVAPVAATTAAEARLLLKPSKRYKRAIKAGYPGCPAFFISCLLIMDRRN